MRVCKECRMEMDAYSLVSGKYYGCHSCKQIVEDGDSLAVEINIHEEENYHFFPFAAKGVVPGGNK